jgi:flagellar biosynthesis component FlhA
MSQKKIEQAISEFEDSQEELSNAIIEGHIQPEQLAKILTALVRQQISTMRLMAVVGDDKFVKKATFQPYKAVAIFMAGGIALAVVGVLVDRFLS